MNDLVCVKTFKNRIEAEIGKGALGTNGIKAFVSADDEGGVAPYPFQPASSGVKLFVNKKDCQKASNILARNYGRSST